MLLCIGFFVLHLFIFSSGQETTSNETCSRTPLPCVQASTAPIRHECNNDTQCGPGVMCCYTGCARTCVSTDPCDRVVCKLGYLCQTKVPPCQKSTCQTEAYCSPEEQVRCPALRCPTEYCQAGYERVVDSTGCPTCECKRKKDCSPTCSIFCTYGQITSEDGCPVCRCKKEPDNPCTNQTCSPDNECRLVAPPSCQTLPCKPQARCVAKIKSMYDNSCGIKDRTTVGRPVLEQDRVTELDCSQNRCPDASICSTFGANTHRCCWQYTQEQIWTPPKVGECPEEYMISASKESQLCEVDGQCPGEQKCCYRLKSSSLSQYIGACMSPVHKILENKTSLCKGSSIISSVLNMIGAC